jgi:hypothetical protein
MRHVKDSARTLRKDTYDGAAGEERSFQSDARMRNKTQPVFQNRLSRSPLITRYVDALKEIHEKADWIQQSAEAEYFQTMGVRVKRLID